MGACAACKWSRHRCDPDCIFAPYFPSDEPEKFAIICRVFGANNISNWLQKLPAHQRGDAVSSLVCEANARVRDPVYGCGGYISFLEKQLSELQIKLAVAQNQVQKLQMRLAVAQDREAPESSDAAVNMRPTFYLNELPFGEDEHDRSLIRLSSLNSPSHSLPPPPLTRSLSFDTIPVIIDSPRFLSMINGTCGSGNAITGRPKSFDKPIGAWAAILFSYGTTGRVKGVLLNHSNLIALIGGFYHLRHLLDSPENEPDPVSLFTLPLFRVWVFLDEVARVRR
ncbi:hypothetical protein K1719_045716 [Acacia pycnantha]|nr:hypothetical protein K1719_045716 [Acacia pycnantha]